MPTYRVTWEIDIDADSPRAAAERAQEMMRDPESIATVFKVEDKHDVTVIDLLEGEEDCVTDDERSNGPKKTGGKHE